MSAKDNKLKPLEIDIKNKIEQFLGVSEQSIDEYVNRYNTVIDIPYQYLAHIIRTLETYIRKNEPFTIDSKQYTPIEKIGSFYYFNEDDSGKIKTSKINISIEGNFILIYK